MPKFRRRPSIVEAVQWTGPDMNPRPKGVFELGTKGHEGHHFYVITIQGKHAQLTPGDWIMPERNGINYYPCDPTEMDELYERIPHRELTDSEQHLVASLGIYGCWLVKHGRLLPEDADWDWANEVKVCYANYLLRDGGNNSGMDLFAAINRFCTLCSWEPPFKNYSEALKDLTGDVIR